MIKEAILKVYKHEDLTYEEAYETMDEILEEMVQIHSIFPLHLPL